MPYLKNCQHYLNMLWIMIIFFQTLMIHKPTEASKPDPEQLDKVLKDFILVKGMKMDEYSYWWSPVSFEECAEKCIHETTISCRSFSYTEEGDACSTYEHDRSTAPAQYYNRPGVLSALSGDLYENYEWNYFERKSEKYRRMESQVERLQNLTEIDVEEASALLTGIAGMMKPEGDSSDEKEEHGNDTASPGELEMAGKSLMLIMDLNPIATASLEVAKEFTNVVVNVSSTLTDTSHVAAWKAAQKDPSSPGSSAIVTSAEKLSERVSAKLLSAQSVIHGITSKADGIAVWLDVASSQPPSNQFDQVTIDQLLKQNTPSNESLIQRLPETQVYVFPSSHMRTPSNKNLSDNEEDEDAFDDETDYFQDLIVLPRAALGNKSVVTNVRYKNLKESMPTRFTEDSKFVSSSTMSSSNRLNSAVLTTSVFPRPPNELFEDEPVTIIFKHIHAPRQASLATEATNATNASLTDQTQVQSPAKPEPQNEENVFCVYWQEGHGEDDGGLWSKEGCTLVDFNQTHTVCNCTHLTSFAVLLQIVDYNTDDAMSKLHLQVLGVISKVGCALSLLGVIIMCAAFVKLKFHTDNMKIHFNLGVAVGLADLTFLFEEVAKHNKAGCVMMTIFLYYFNMAVLAWMLVEGVHLYSQVVVVFVSIRRRVKYYLLAGWGIPAVLLAISMGILNEHLGVHETCWLSPNDNSIWAFAAPALLVIVVNMIILVSVVRVIIKIQPGKSSHMKVSKLRNAVKGSIFLFPLLGTTWLFGLLSLSKETLVFQYLFAITNSMQGFFLFIFHCMCNSEVREDARRHKWFRSNDSSVSSSSPPFFSHAFNFNVASGIRRFRHSISFDAPSSVSGGTEGHSEGDENVTKRLKTGLLFPRLFSTRLPTIIAEKEDKYEESEDMATNEAAEQVETQLNTGEDIENVLPLPGMPTKNDSFLNLDQFNHSLTADTQIQLDQLLVDQIIQNALKEMFKDISGGEDAFPEKLDDPEVEKEDKEKKMQMSYDSGLNSIENESMLDEDDEVWMEMRSDKVEKQIVKVAADGQIL